MKILAGILGGLLIVTLAAIVISVGGASKMSRSGSYREVAFVVLWVVGVVVAVKAPSTAKAWSRLLITSGAMSFLLPLSAIILFVSNIAGTFEKGGEDASAAAAGTAVGYGLISGFVGSLGYFSVPYFLSSGCASVETSRSSKCKQHHQAIAHARSKAQPSVKRSARTLERLSVLPHIALSRHPTCGMRAFAHPDRIQLLTMVATSRPSMFSRTDV